MAGHDLLNTLKGELEQLYEITVPVDILDFVITDPDAARAIADDEGFSPHENLFVCSDGDETAVTLFIDASIVAALDGDDPMVALHDGNLGPFCVALEGVSHFTYLAWRAHHDRQVSQLELEMQAEVDKFVTTAMLMGRQSSGRIPSGLGQRLFEQVSYRPGLDAPSRERYETASAYAERYCKGLERRIMDGRDGQTLTRDLRRFYRLDQHQKMRHISALG
jgi:hypothetical protein